MEKEEIMRRIWAQINVGGHIIGASVGSGITAKLAAMGGADVLLALAAGRYRIMGRSSLSSFFCYGNNNSQVMDLGTREILPIVRDVPLFFGLMASDPTIHLYDYLCKIRDSGFSGIVNSPTLSVIDGKFRIALEEEGTSYSREIAAVRMASHLGLMSMAFVTNQEETEQMLDAGADAICLHLGLTKGGFLGAKHYLSLGDARRTVKKIFSVCKERNPEVLRFVYAGPANTIKDMRYLLKNSDCHGYIGGSTFDRIPMETSIYDTVRTFKRHDEEKSGDSLNRLMDRKWGSADLVKCVKEYIMEHYMETVHLGDLAMVTHMSPAYLGTKFRQETGVGFTEFLMGFRLERAKELLETEKDIRCREVAEKVGYTDYIQFSKMFKKHVGESPKDYQQRFGVK